MVVGDPEPTFQRHKLPLPMRQSPGADRDRGGKKRIRPNPEKLVSLNYPCKLEHNELEEKGPLHIIWHYWTHSKYHNRRIVTQWKFLSELPGRVERVVDVKFTSDLKNCALRTGYLRFTAHLSGYSCTNCWGALTWRVPTVEVLVLNHLLTYLSTPNR